jgi:hypothetical protein
MIIFGIDSLTRFQLWFIWSLFLVTFNAFYSGFLSRYIVCPRQEYPRILYFVTIACIVLTYITFW